MSLLKKMVKKTATDVKAKAKSKSNVPTIPTDDPEIIKAVDRVRNAITAMKKSKADFEIFGDELIELFHKHQETEARIGDFRKSYKIAGTEDTEVKIVQANKVLKIASADIVKIKKILKKSDFERLFEETESVSLKPEVFKNDELADELMARLGKDETEQSENFAKFFTSTEGLKVKPDYDKNRFKLTGKAFNSLRIFVRMIRPGIQ